jgi:outer membrane lipoprotein SlyB
MRIPVPALTVALPALCALSLFPASSYAQAARMKDCLQLTVKDHTRVIRSIQGKLGPVTELVRKQNIDVHARTTQNSQRLLNTIARSRILDDATNQTLDHANLCLAVTSASDIRVGSKAAIAEIAVELDKADSVPDAIERLGRLKGKYPDANDVREAITVTSSILQDGRPTIYNDKDEVFQTLASKSAEQPSTKGKTAKEYAVDLAAADGKGAINGAVGGCFAGLLAGGVGCGPGALAGGVAGAIGSSAQELVEKAWKKTQ